MCPITEMMCNGRYFGKALRKYCFLPGSSVASPSTSGHEKQESHPPLKEYHRSKRPVPPPRTQKTAGRHRYN